MWIGLVFSLDIAAKALESVHRSIVSNNIAQTYTKSVDAYYNDKSVEHEIEKSIIFYVYYRQIMYGSRSLPKNGFRDQITTVLPSIEHCSKAVKSDSLTAFYSLVLLTNSKNGFKIVKNKKEGKFSVREFSVDVSKKFHKLIDPILSSNDKLPIARFANASYRFYSESKVTEEQLRYLSETADICRDTPWELEAYNYLLMNETAKYGKFSNTSQARALAALKKYKGTIYAEAWEQTRNWWETNKY